MVVRPYRGFIADNKASGFDASADGHFCPLDVDQALEAGVTCLRVRQILSFQNQFPCHSARHQHVLDIRWSTKFRAVARTVRH